ncbi:MAG: hypothetical protein PHN59_03825 [Candidatus Omnitrophica bacterium]|nr:hypothetical protein [Candidatus Omnitrophota bacterium]
MTKSKIQNKFKIQASNLKTKVLSLVICALGLSWILCFDIGNYSYAQENNLAVLSKQIMEAKPDANIYPVFEQLKAIYFKDNKYPEFLDFLKSLNRKKKTLQTFTNYYTALSRFYQLKYLEDIQDWNEYFSEGDSYRAELEKTLNAAIKESKPGEALNLAAQFLFYRYHKEKQDGQAQGALKDIVNSATEYSKKASDVTLIKDIADQLLSSGEKTESRKLYDLYVEKLSSSEIKSADLGNIALDFYNKGNLELSEAVYDAYIKKVGVTLPKEELIPLLINIAKKFAYKDEGQSDPAYAEKIFQEIEKRGGANAFDEDLIYLRAFNLEKMQQVKEAKEIYLSLLKANKASKYADEAEFKIAVFDTYLLSNPEEGKSYFTGLIKKEKISPQVISAFYQLGLLSQWKEDHAAALNYYNQLITLAKSDFQDLLALTQERVKEINEKKALEYNLRAFLDAALNSQGASAQTGKVSLFSKPYKVKKSGQVLVDSNTAVPESGCTQVELQYLWSGDLGEGAPTSNQSSFSTKYQYSGTKVINVVVVNPSGITDYGLDLVDTLPD